MWDRFEIIVVKGRGKSGGGGETEFCMGISC